MPRKVYTGPKGGQYIMKYGKKRYLNNKFGHGPELDPIAVEQAREASRRLQRQRQTWQQAQDQANAAILAEIKERVRLAEEKEKQARAAYRKVWKKFVRLSVLAEKTFPYYKVFSREAAAIRRARRHARYELYRPGGLDDIVDEEYAKLEIAIDEANRVRREEQLARQTR